MAANHQIVVKVRPQLIKKMPQPHISVVVSPAKVQVANLKTIKQLNKKPCGLTPQRIASPVSRQSVQPSPPPQNQGRIPISAVARQKFVKQTKKGRKTEVKYITREINPESAQRIASMRGKGAGKLLVIVANGPSILEADLARLANQPNIEILTINKPDPRIWPTHYWAFFDTSQYNRNEDLWHGYNGFIFNSTAIKNQKQTSMQFKNLGGRGWSRDLMKGLHIGRSSAYASMQIAQWMMHTHVYLFGVDMNPDGIDGKLHFYGNNPDVTPERRRASFAKEAEYYDYAADGMSESERKSFTFCSSYNHHGFVNKFNRLDHKAAVDIILGHAASL